MTRIDRSKYRPSLISIETLGPIFLLVAIFLKF